jgi:hypothetical protein
MDRRRRRRTEGFGTISRWHGLGRNYRAGSCRRHQCRDRWHNALNPNITLAAGRAATWIKDVATKLKNSILTRHAAKDGKDWDAVTAVLSGSNDKRRGRRGTQLATSRLTYAETFHTILGPAIVTDDLGRLQDWLASLNPAQLKPVWCNFETNLDLARCPRPCLPRSRAVLPMPNHQLLVLPR